MFNHLLKKLRNKLKNSDKLTHSFYYTSGFVLFTVQPSPPFFLSFFLLTKRGNKWMKSDKFILKNPILLFDQVYSMLNIGFYWYRLISPRSW